MAKKPYVLPPAQQDEEMVVTVVRFRGSGESLRKGFETLSQAFAGAFGAGTHVTTRQVNGRKVATQLTGSAEPADVEEADAEDGGDTLEREVEEALAVPVPPKVKKPGKKLYTFMTDLNLAPAGKMAWKEHAAAKNPDGFNERLLVASAWLQTEGGLQHFAGGELFTCFRAMEWPTQADMTNSMRKLKGKKSYYDNPDFGKWRLTGVGLDAANAIAPKS